MKYEEQKRLKNIVNSSIPNLPFESSKRVNLNSSVASGGPTSEDLTEGTAKAKTDPQLIMKAMKRIKREQAMRAKRKMEEEKMKQKLEKQKLLERQKQREAEEEEKRRKYQEIHQQQGRVKS